MEASLSDLESNAAPAFQKVRDSRWLGVLSGEERVWIAVFAAAQRLRVRNLREAMKHFDAGVVERIRQLGGDPNAVKGFQPFRNEEEVRHFSLGFLAKAMPAIATLILSKRWLLFETSRTCPFWLSDNPITMYNHEDFGPYGTIGFAVRGIQIHLPLSPTLTLGFWCPSLEDLFREAVSRLSTSTAKLEDIAGTVGSGVDPKLDEHIARGRRSLAGLAEVLKGMQAGTTVPCDAGNVQFFNWLQLAWAERYLMSASEDWSLARGMLSDHPDLRKGSRFRLD